MKSSDQCGPGSWSTTAIVEAPKHAWSTCHSTACDSPSVGFGNVLLRASSCWGCGDSAKPALSTRLAVQDAAGNGFPCASLLARSPHEGKCGVCASLALFGESAKGNRDTSFLALACYKQRKRQDTHGFQTPFLLSRFRLPSLRILPFSSAERQNKSIPTFLSRCPCLFYPNLKIRGVSCCHTYLAEAQQF